MMYVREPQLKFRPFMVMGEIINHQPIDARWQDLVPRSLIMDFSDSLRWELQLYSQTAGLFKHPHGVQGHEWVHTARRSAAPIHP